MDLSRQIEAAVGSLGRRVRRVIPLAAPAPSKRGRSTWRIETEDGESLKARCLESEAAARKLCALRAELEPAFVPALGWRGPVVVEEWIEGRPLGADETEIHAAEAGALLGRLHATRRPATISTGRWRARAEADLDTVHAAGALAEGEIAALREELARQDPGCAPTALLHRDFCAENMLVDEAGRLRVIDNEWFDVDAAGLDLGRTLQRWPMPAAARRGFLAAYRGAAPVDPGPLDFWVLVAVLWSARVRLDQPAARREIPLAAARRLAAREVLY